MHYFAEYTTIEQKRWSAVAHALAAVAAILIWIAGVALTLGGAAWLAQAR